VPLVCFIKGNANIGEKRGIETKYVNS